MLAFLLHQPDGSGPLEYVHPDPLNKAPPFNEKT